MCKVYTCYCDTSEIELGLCAFTVDNTLAKARGLSLRTGAQTMLYLSLSFDDFISGLMEIIYRALLNSLSNMYQMVPKWYEKIPW